MGCTNSTPATFQANPDTRTGVFVVEIVNVKHLPVMDIGSLTDAYVVLELLAQDGKEKLTPAIHTLPLNNTLDPVFHTFIAFPIDPKDSDILQLKVLDEDVAKDDKIGHVNIDVSYLRQHPNEDATFNLNMATKTKSKDGQSPCITVRFHPRRSVTPVGKFLRKEVFVIRHGESKWNEGQSKKNVKELMRQYDHELTKKGIEQAADFNRRWKAVQANTPEDEDLKLFLSAQKIYASPLTRASETALVTCHDHPCLASQGMTLLRNLREVKNFGSFDTVGQYEGEAIVKHVHDCLAADSGEEQAKQWTSPKIDVNDSFGEWWTALERKEDHKHVSRRQNDIFSTLRYGTDASVIILVGHSHFFRHFVHTNMADDYRLREPGWTKMLDTAKSDNSACMQLTLEWRHRDLMANPCILNAKLVFGSKLAGGIDNDVIQPKDVELKDA